MHPTPNPFTGIAPARSTNGGRDLDRAGPETLSRGWTPGTSIALGYPPL
jgi:hypothetical protein